MSSILISNLIDLEFIVNDDIYLCGSSSGVKEEIYNNFWQISFDENLSLKLSKNDLHYFLSLLLKKRKEQIAIISNTLVVTFYMWVDEQSNQLCFNLLSGQDITLPFGCTVHVVNSVDIIFNKFIHVLRNPALSWNNIEIIEQGDSRWDSDEEDIDPKKYVLEVYVTILSF